MESLDFSGRKVFVTGHTGFKGSWLCSVLLELGADVSGFSLGVPTSPDMFSALGLSKRVRGHSGDVSDFKGLLSVVKRENPEIVFHLAADHGGRGYVDLHQVECSTNLILDGMIFRTAREIGVKKVVYASSGCVYPNHMQMNPDEELYLTEDMVGPPYDADNMYGWAKLMGELTLKSYYDQFGMKSASCRYFTVYGPRGVENHAVIAMIARAFIGEDPFAVWGTGEQVRNWTYIDDIVSGTILAAEKIDNAAAINLGTMERIRVMDAVEEVLRYTGHKARVVVQPEMPTGPLNRVAENRLARQLLGWEPRTPFMEGLHQTIDWYFAGKDRERVRAILGRMLTER